MDNSLTAITHNKFGWVLSLGKFHMLSAHLNQLQPSMLQFIGPTQSLMPNA